MFLAFISITIAVDIIKRTLYYNEMKKPKTTAMTKKQVEEEKEREAVHTLRSFFAALKKRDVKEILEWWETRSKMK